MKKVKVFFDLIRIKHWIKNCLIFIPVICAKLISFENILITILGFVSFSFATSFVYIVNDIRDVEKDKLHPRKKNRPLPSGKIKKSTAICIAVLMISLALIINTCINNCLSSFSLGFVVTYIILNLGYSFGLKNVAILDVVILATGFILRVYYGAEIVNVEVSNWLFLTVLNASLFLGLGKRRKEIINNKNSRKVLEEYNEQFLDKFQYLTLTLMFVFYSLWAIEQNINFLFLTIPLLMIIFMRYCLINEKSEEGDPTTIIYQDKSLFGLCFLYAILMIIFMVVL